MTKKIIILLVSVIIAGNLYSQTLNTDAKLELREEIVKMKTKDTIINAQEKENKKSPGISLLLSILLPGAGHFYADRMDVGQYFIASEAALWLGLGGMTYYGNTLQDNARSYAVLHSGITNDGKDEDYYVNIADFNNIYEYNNYKLIRGEYDKVYFDISKNFWNWDNEKNRYTYDDNRKKSEQILNSRIVFVSGLIINRVASAVSSLILTKRINETSNLSTEFTYDQRLRIDGLKLNLKMNF